MLKHHSLAKHLLSVGTDTCLLASWNFTFCVFARLQSDPLSPFTRCLAFYSSAEMAISIPMGAMWCSRSNPCPSHSRAMFSLSCFYFKLRISTTLHIFSMLRQTVLHKSIAIWQSILCGNSQLVFILFKVGVHSTVLDKKSPQDPNVHRPRFHIVTQQFEQLAVYL